MPLFLSISCCSLLSCLARKYTTHGEPWDEMRQDIHLVFCVICRPLGLMMRPLIERLYGPSRLPSSRLETAHALAAYLSLSFPYACLPEVQVSDMLFAYWQSALYEAKQGDASVLAWLPFGELSALLDRYKSRGPLGQLTEALARSIDRIVNESLPTSIHACVLRLNVLSIQSPCFDTLHPGKQRG